MSRSSYASPTSLLKREIIAHQLRDARQQSGLGQTELARLVGIPQPNLSDYERGRRDISLEMIGRLCHILGIEPTRVVRQAAGELAEDERKILLHYARSDYNQHAFGDALLQMRKQAGLRQTAFESSARVSSWENGLIRCPEPAAILEHCRKCSWAVDRLLLNARVLESQQGQINPNKTT